MFTRAIRVVIVLAVWTEAALSASVGPVARAPQESVPTCIAITVPSVRGVDGNASDVGSGLRELFATFLTGPSMRVMPLDDRKH